MAIIWKISRDTAKSAPDPHPLAWKLQVMVFSLCSNGTKHREEKLAGQVIHPGWKWKLPRKIMKTHPKWASNKEGGTYLLCYLLPLRESTWLKSWFFIAPGCGILGTGKEEQLNSTESEIFSESTVVNYWPATTGSYSEVSISLMSIVWRSS